MAAADHQQPRRSHRGRFRWCGHNQGHQEEGSSSSTAAGQTSITWTGKCRTTSYRRLRGGARRCRLRSSARCLIASQPCSVSRGCAVMGCAEVGDRGSVAVASGETSRERSSPTCGPSATPRAEKEPHASRGRRCPRHSSPQALSRVLRSEPSTLPGKATSVNPLLHQRTAVIELKAEFTDVQIRPVPASRAMPLVAQLPPPGTPSRTPSARLG